MHRKKSGLLWTIIILSILVIFGGLSYLKLQKETVAAVQNTLETNHVESQKQETLETGAMVDPQEIEQEFFVEEEPESSEGEEVESDSAPLLSAPCEEEVEVWGAEQETQVSDFTNLEHTLQAEIENRPAKWSVVVVDLSDQQTIVCDNAGTAAAKTTAASLIKLYIMAAAYDRVQAGLLADTEALEQSIRRMITVSSNEDTNAVLRLIGDGDSSLGMQRVNAYCAAQGYSSTQVNRLLGVSDYAVENFTSAVDCGRILSAIYQGTCVSAQRSQQMLSLLQQQTVTYKIPAGILNSGDAENAVVGNKTGELSGRAEHDVAIVTGEDFQYVLCVLCEDSGQDVNVVGEISHISEIVLETFSEKTD